VTDNVRTVSIGEVIVSNALDDVLVAYGIGSCVAVCLHDPVAKIGGMLHALLPTAPNGNPREGNPEPSAKYVDHGVSLLIGSLVELGAKRTRLVAQLCGGAQVLNAPGFDGWLNIGERNVKAARSALRAAGLRIKAQATGGQIGRTVRLYIADGRVTLRSLGRGEQPISKSDKLIR
jgi:chemotaxis protein CheD